MFDMDSFESIVNRLHGRLISYSDICRETTPEEDWSITELVSHLIDSASNNHQRFIRLQVQDELRFPGYDAETWRRISHAKGMDYLRLVELWKLFNWYILEVIKNLDPKTFGNRWVIDGESHTLEYLVNDYYKHLVWHEDLFQVIERRLRT